MTEQISEEDLRRAIKNYLFFTEPIFCKQFSNWLESGDWRSWVTLSKAQSDLQIQALRFVDKWSFNFCSIVRYSEGSFWPEIQNLARCRRLFCYACCDPYFKENWEKGLIKMRKWTERPSFALLTISWFCDREKSVLERILENTYKNEHEESYRYAPLQPGQTDGDKGHSDEGERVASLLRQINFSSCDDVDPNNQE